MKTKIKGYFIKTAAMAFLTIGYVGCKKDVARKITDPNNIESSIQQGTSIQELAYTNKTDLPKGVTFQGKKILAEEIENELVFEGDIFIRPGESNTTEKSIGRPLEKYR